MSTTDSVVPTSLRVNQGLLNALDEAALVERRSRSNLMHLAFEFYLESKHPTLMIKDHSAFMLLQQIEAGEIKTSDVTLKTVSTWPHEYYLRWLELRDLEGK